ncbi:DAK2 domain-containing protein [Desulfitobacterium sp. THU1]|uniref:DAK2 domain-containing protein n=1 Tax=Desulfitobacterium sp. THU1 TaxID=3138072 RepID=UPI00311F2C6C
MITGLQWKQMMRIGARALERKKHDVDALNVFPVPDGDTGTNMNFTIQSAVKDAEKTSGASVAEVATAVSMGSLMGARGNSGVILSQLLRGIAKGLEGHKEASGQQVAQALQVGVDTAYKAVMKPVEGTILTVAREVAKGAQNSAKHGATPLQILKDAYVRGQLTLDKTPDMLPVLKQAGVVDAGGQGFLIILSGWIAALEGQEFEEEIVPATLQAEPQMTRGITAVENLEFPYCTEFLVKGQNLRVEKIRGDLAASGDSLLVVGTEEVVKIHVHVKNPGKILDYAVQWGSLHQVAIHNMLEQNEAMAHAQKHEELEEGSLEETPLEEKEHGIVAVAMGEGIADVFRSLGVDEVIFGGQTMNPSTENIVEAVRKVAAKNVYILPNNGNIVMAARQVKELVTDRNVYIVPTKSIPQGISALVNYNPQVDGAENAKNMEDGLSLIKSGEVTYAVRDSQFGELEISEGDVLGLIEDVIQVTGKDLLQVAKETLDTMKWKDHDLVTVFYGEDVTEEQAEELRAWIEAEAPHIELELYPGHQPLYYYIFGVE